MIVTLMCRFLVLVVVSTVAIPESGSITGSSTLLLSDRGPVPRRCRYDKVFRMLQARCADLNLKEIPQTLQKDIQILDFSGNRLRELHNNTLSSFTSLSYLYLTDNFIQSIGGATFTNLKSLQVLDMTKNGLIDFPKNILALPQLKKLYLSENQLSDNILCFDSTHGESNLEFLDLSYNHLTQIPIRLNLPQLKYLNVSGNSISKIKSEEIAAFCSLEVLDLSRNPFSFEDNCECHSFNSWIESKKIKILPEDIKCPSPRKRRDQRLSGCSTNFGNNFISNETLRVFEGCKVALKIREETIKARTTWIIVASCLGVFIFCLLVVLYFIHKRNKKRKKLRSPQKDLATMNHHAEDELLNANTCEKT